MNEAISSIKIRDLEIFLEVSRAKSIREVARRLNTTPGNVSKTIQHLEAKLGTKLYKRSVSGVLLTAQGVEILEIANEMIDSSESLKTLIFGQGKTKIKKTLGIASTSFLNTHLVASVTSELGENFLDYSFRFLDLAPDQMVPVALRGAFEISLHYGAISWPSTWVTQKIGKTRWVLVARGTHPIARRATLKQLLGYSFIYPVYWTQEGLVKGNDQFPVPISKRKMGYETATADAAVPILLKTDQLAFLPEILVRPFVAQKALKIIECPQVQTMERELYLSVRSEFVPDKIFKEFIIRLGKECAP